MPDTIEQASGLAAALAAFQGEITTFPKTKTAKVKSQRTGGEYIYKYADLGDILPVVGPLLSKHGLSWTSKPARDDQGELVLRYRLLHVSGEVDEGEMPLGVAKDCKPQELGSAITYMRRYALSAQLNLATQEDDDGQAAQHADRGARASNRNGNGAGRQPVSQVNGDGSERPATAKQRGLLNAKAAETELTAEEFAGALLKAAGQEPREFESTEHAQNFVNRQLDRLPARLVDAVLSAIEDAAIPF